MYLSFAGRLFMAKYKPEEVGQGYFITIYPDEIFNDNSIEKVISRFIDTFVDTSPFDKKYKNDTVGQKAISPLAKLKVILYGLSQGIESMRKIEKMLQLHHPGFLFLSGNRHIDHSTLCYFLNDFPEDIAKIFGRLLMILEELKLIDWRRVMIDGTKISSNASIELTGNASSFEKMLKQYENLSAKLLDRAKDISAQMEDEEESQEEISKEKERIERQQKKYTEIIKKIKEYEDKLKAGNVSAHEKINLTDRESCMLKKDKDLMQGYNVQAAFSSNDILLSIETTSKSNDKNMISDMVTNVESLKRRNHVDGRSEYLLDKGYFNVPQMSELIREGKDLYVAPPHHFTENWFINREHHILQEDSGVYLICKGNRKRKGKLRKSDNSYEFFLSRNFCIGCEQFSPCWKDKDQNKNKYFDILETYVRNRDLWFDYFNRVKTVEWKRKYNRRIGKEHNFFDLKSNNGLRRFHWRGRNKCNTIAIMAGISYNLKKFQKAIMNIGWGKVQEVMG
jgi:transposase